jgi:hypothetical protein
MVAGTSLSAICYDTRLIVTLVAVICRLGAVHSIVLETHSQASERVVQFKSSGTIACEVRSYSTCYVRVWSLVTVTAEHTPPPPFLSALQGSI